ncbi:MAG TPA: ABC-2 family transporter protein [Candidatus Dormibacteraeota bacterium]
MADAAPARPHLALLRASVRSQTSYRASTVLLTIGAAGATCMDFLMIAAIMSHLPRLAGWSLAEIGLLYGIAGVAFGITDMCVGNLDLLPRVIRDGSFDMVLIRPVGALFQVVAMEFGVRRVGKVFQAGVVLAVSLTQLHVAWTAPRVAMLAMAPVTAALIFGSVWVIAITQVFWTVDTAEAANSVTYGGNFLTSYPITVFGTWLRDLLAFVIPMAFVSYYPALFILGRPDPIGLPAFTPLLTPAVALAALGVARVVWWTGVRHYRGTGS